MMVVGRRADPQIGRELSARGRNHDKVMKRAKPDVGGP
jgi:hypothetical protein